MAKQKRNTSGLVPFQPGQSGNMKGRPPKLVHHINEELKAEGYEPVKNAQVLDAFQTLINLPISKIAAIANKEISYKDESGKIVYLQQGDNYPLLYRLAAKELLGTRGGEYLEKLLDRSFGKAMIMQKIGGDPDNPINSEMKIIIVNSPVPIAESEDDIH